MNGAEERQLATALGANIGTFGGSARVDHLAREDWASVTFSGARHRLRVTLEGAGAVGAAADFLERLPDVDLVVPGQLVADLALLAEARSDDGRYAALDLEALTLTEI